MGLSPNGLKLSLCKSEAPKDDRSGSRQSKIPVAPRGLSFSENYSERESVIN
jgi:hypothetical protein